MQKVKNIWHFINAVAANIVFKFPTREMTVIGVTGTDGKTTTATAIYHILSSSGSKTALISTVGAVINGKFVETGLHTTTPGPKDIQRFARQAVSAGCKYLVLETTSIGLDQYRDWGIKYKLGIVTNLSHEHIDYHGSMYNYALSKFKLLKRSKIRLITPHTGEIFKLSSNLPQLHTYSYNNQTEFTEKDFAIPSVLGDYNKENLVGASAACFLLGIPVEVINRSLRTFSLPEGRMQKISTRHKGLFFIDFGHTPQALEKALSSIKKTYPDKKIISVFGAAGQRDFAKRPMMGKAASRYSQIIIITSEDPRTENQTKIASDIVSGFLPQFLNKYRYFIVDDRQQAISKAVELSNSKTICLFFGKGHERSLNINGKELPWDEKKAVLKALKK